RVRRMVEVDQEVVQALPWTKRVRRPAESRNGLGQLRAGGLEVALLAHTHLQFGSQLRRLYNRTTNLLPLCAPARCQLDVTCARRVASLAIDALGKSLGKGGYRAVSVSPGDELGRRIVAKHAGVVDLAGETRVSGPIVAGAHPPAILLRVPCDRKFGC